MLSYLSPKQAGIIFSSNPILFLELKVKLTLTVVLRAVWLRIERLTHDAAVTVSTKNPIERQKLIFTFPSCE